MGADVLPRTLVALFTCLALALTALPAVDAEAKKPKNKRAACIKKAKKIKAKKKRKKAVKRCHKKYKVKRKARPRPATPAPPAPAVAAPRVEGGIDDATVVAVLDGGINPYHWDFLASKMPQHANGTAGDDLPLQSPATDWLPGVASAGFKSFERIDLELDANDPDAGFGDEAPLNGRKPSAPGNLNAYWFPDTKIIGAMSFADPGDFWQGADAHGVGTTSSVVGNIHGTCPECLLFFVDYGHTAEQAEAAIEWAESQPWIDVISNSYGHGGAVPKIYAGSNTEAQRAAVERGQQIVFSAGNGVENAFAVTNPTSYSSQKGPDWILTVGGVQPEEDGGGSYSGAGKPADVAGVANNYPNAYGATTVGGAGSGFGGTSNAAPTVAGLYARALYQARTTLRGPSKVQQDGVIATGDPIACGPAHAGCELGDGRLTEPELRTRLLHAATHTSAGLAFYTAGGPEAGAPPVGEEEFLNEGHGTFFARDGGPADNGWIEELGRITGPLTGAAAPLARPEGELEWMTVDSYCRQQNWGSWTRGYYVEGQSELPGPSPQWPVRSAYEAGCPGGPTPAG